MLNFSAWGTALLGGGGLLTGALAIFSARSNKKKIDSETIINATSAEHSHEKLVQDREIFWRTEVDKIREALSKELAAARNEIAWLRVLIENHVPWDWEAIRHLKLNGIIFRNPPTLNYIENKNVKDIKESGEE